ncbi:hypothetical protein DM02DRAFT_517299 [Periconia macrospinosa]|uniref:Xylanolytic transcriptional activator regulatory domain-containing protein n=1 Tax=Periconia macrospinosa TaxID=97972 RepID=A0A2V1E3G2_9PLEO|nr:hypothetical protein DM02DRAFT_517299 [Periconia macrospinosa]
MASPASPRKRPSRTLIRACWECKKRKLHGNATETDFASAHGSSEQGDCQNICSSHIGERLGKLEQLFEKFVCRKTSNVDVLSDSQSSISTLVNEKPSYSSYLPKIPTDSHTISSIGDGILMHHAWTSSPPLRTLGSESETESAGDSVNRALVQLLPPQHDADIIFESTNGWMISGLYKPCNDLYVRNDPDTFALDMSAVARERSIIVARTLLHLAVCMSSLPPDFDTSRLKQTWNLETTMENYVKNVSSLITCSDELLSTLPGLETLLLYAHYHMNTANLRNAWLNVRRAMSLAHLMGFHRIVERTSTSAPVEAIEPATRMWRSLVEMERYLGLLLRLPFAADNYPIDHQASPHEVYKARLVTISRQVSELDSPVTPQTYVQALALDEQLESLMREQPKEFWAVPNIPSTARTAESYDVILTLMVQIWHFSHKIFIHLPFLLRATKDNRYEYSKVAALQASRNIIMRWVALRNAGITQACSRAAEVAVFIAAVTLTLDILIEMATKDSKDVQKAKCSDFAMLCRVISELEKLGKASARERIAARSAVVLRNILSTLDPSKRAFGKLKMTVPYFGTIQIQFKEVPTRPAFDLDSDVVKKLNSTSTGQHLPVFSFVSNALWPPSGEMCDECDLDFDIILFDGLQDMDVDGNWVF